MTKSNILIGICVAFAIGIFIGSEVLFGNRQVEFIIAGLVTIFALSFYFHWKAAASAALFLIFVGVGVVIVNINNSRVPNQFSGIYNTKQQLEGYIVEDVDVRENDQLITFQPNGYRQRILLTVPLKQNYFYGDWVVVSGNLKQPQPFDDFDYPEHLKLQNIYATIGYPQILVLEQHQGNRLKEQLLRLKHGFINRLDAVYPEPEKSLLLALLFGDKHTLPQNIINDFDLTGGAHIIAVSGYKLTLLISWLGFLPWLIGRRWSFSVCAMTVIVFVVITGAPAAAVRAGIMGILLLLSPIIGRQYRIGAALCLSAALMLLLNPNILVHDVGFQLSFLGTLGIIYFLPLLEKFTHNWPKFYKTKEYFLVTIAAIIATLPIMLYDFSAFSVYAPVVNILILLILPVVLAFGLLSAVPLIGPGCAFLNKYMLDYMMAVVAWFAHLHFGNFSVPIPAWFTAVLFLTLPILYWIFHHLAEKVPEVEEYSGL